MVHIAGQKVTYLKRRFSMRCDLYSRQRSFIILYIHILTSQILYIDIVGVSWNIHTAKRLQSSVCGP